MRIVLADSANDCFECRVAVQESLVPIQQMIDVDAVLFTQILLSDGVPYAKEGGEECERARKPVEPEAFANIIAP